MPPTDLQTAATLLDFVELYLADEQAGRPRVLDAYLTRFPEHTEAITAEFQRLEQTATSSGTPSAWSPGAIEEGTALQLPGPDDTVGTYRIVRELGRGGQAVVYLAHDERLDRQVALKVLRKRWDDAGTWRERLRREVQIVAGLDHPGLCTVYQANLERDPPCIAMRYIDGQTLASVISARRHGDADGEPCRPRTRQELHRLLDLIEQVARALHVAHEQGIVHRDVKPGNIMLGRDGRAVVLDFGLARRTESDWKELTDAGEAFGTPGYMSPEQIRGDPVDRRTDVFSLGVTLFEALTSQRPFDGRSRRSMEQAICEQVTPDPLMLNDRIPADVRTVLARALEKEPSRRYETAEALADDLGRIRRFEAIHARPVGAFERLLLWRKRNPVLALALVALFLSLSIGLAISLDLLFDERAALRRVEALRLASEARSAAEARPYRALQMAMDSLALEETPEARTALVTALEGCTLETILGSRSSHMTELTASLDGDLLALAHADGTWQVWDLDHRTLVGRGREPSEVASVCLLPMGELLVATRGHGALIRKVADGTLSAHVRVAGDAPLTSAFFGGDRLLFAADDGGLYAADRIDGGWPSVATRIGIAPIAQRITATDPAGSRVLTTRSRYSPGDADDHTAWLWPLDDGPTEPRELVHEGVVYSARFSPDGRLLATAAHDGLVTLWDATDARPLRTLRHQERVQGIAFSPDGRRLLSFYDPGDPMVSRETGLSLWDVDSGSLVRMLEGHGGRLVNDASFSPDGRRIASVGYDGTARIWDAGSGAELQRLHGLGERLHRTQWTADGQRLVGWSPRHSVVWSLNPRDVITLNGHAGAVLDIGYSPDGKQVATSGEDGTLRIWSSVDGRPLHVLRHGDAHLSEVAVDPTGTRIAAAGSDGDATLWDARDGTLVARLEHGSAPLTLCRFSDSGDVLVTACEAGVVVLWEAASGARLLDLDGHEGAVTCADFNADGSLLATGGADRTCRVWRTTGGREAFTLCGWEETLDNPLWKHVFDVRFTERGNSLLVASEDNHVREWSLEGTEPVLARSVRWTAGFADVLPDGTILSTSKWRGVARLGDTSTHETTESLHGSRITSAALSPDRSLLLTTSLEGVASITDVSDLSRMVDLTGHGDFISAGCFSPDGTRVATASKDGTARLWPVDPAAAARRRMPIDLTLDERDG